MNMRLLQGLALLGLAIGVAACATKLQTRKPLPTASHVDLHRYAGKWNEIARLPNRFQRRDSLALAQYTLRPDGGVSVKNTEIHPDGSLKTIEGNAVPAAGSENARLKVRFGGLAALVPVPSDGNYWIIDVAPDYSVALVGTPDRKFLWLLARSPDLPRATRDRYLQKAKALGFPTERVIIHHWSAPAA